jgi:hypothetical protein
MELNLPPGLPSHPPDMPDRPVVVPILPTRRRPRGRQAPLPDPVAVRQVEVPDWLPPCDGEPAGQAPAASATGTPGGQPEPGSGAPRATRPQPGGRPDDPATGPGEPAARRLTGRDGPGPGGWPSQFAQVLAETLAGSRPAQQLTPWTTEQTRQRIRELGPRLATGQRPRVRRIMTSAPAADVLEMTAVVGFGARVRVLALRLERAGEAGPGWRCTALESA